MDMHGSKATFNHRVRQQDKVYLQFTELMKYKNTQKRQLTF